jgi:hypothetical protein
MTGTISSENQGIRSPGTVAWMDAVAVEGFLVSFSLGDAMLGTESMGPSIIRYAGVDKVYE